jgi:hypothetical protein
MACSDKREKPSNTPPQPAKSKSMPTNVIINLVGILAKEVEIKTETAKNKIETENKSRAQGESSGVLGRTASRNE